MTQGKAVFSWLMADAPDPVDLDFLEARAHALSLAAYLDRVERAGREDDFRHQALLKALPEAIRTASGAGRAAGFLEALSDHSMEPLARSPGQGACGAPPPDAG